MLAAIGQRIAPADAPGEVLQPRTPTVARRDQPGDDAGRTGMEIVAQALSRGGFPANVARAHRAIVFEGRDGFGEKFNAKGRQLEALLPRGKPGIAVLTGIPGTGKSLMAYALAFSRVHRGATVAPRYEAFGFICARLRSVYQPAATENELGVLNDLTAPGLLVIDEFFMRRDTALELHALPLLLCRRYDRGRHTILISVEDVDRLAGALDGSIQSRMEESGGYVRLDWPSFRTRDAARQVAVAAPT
jgi:hypothetical protein